MPLGAPAALVKCTPGDKMPGIAGDPRVLCKHRYSKIVINAGMEDKPICQSEVTKGNFQFKIAKAMSDAVICSDPIPKQHADVAYKNIA